MTAPATAMEKGKLIIWPHYKTYDINREPESNAELSVEQVWEFLHDFFEDGKGNGMNWLIGSTSGVHGSYKTLDEIENRLKRPRKHPIKHHDKFTILSIQPRLCVLRYGNVVVSTLEQVEWIYAPSSPVLLKQSLKAKGGTRYVKLVRSKQRTGIGNCPCYNKGKMGNRLN